MLCCHPSFHYRIPLFVVRAQPQNDPTTPSSPSKTGFSVVDVVVRQSTGQVEYMCNVDATVPSGPPPPLLRVKPEKDVLQQVVDATMPEIQLLPPSPPSPPPQPESQPISQQEQEQELEWAASLQEYSRSQEQWIKSDREQESVPSLPKPRVNLTSSIGKYNVYYSAGNVANTLRVVKK